MRRVETYVGMQVYEWLFSADAQNTMTAIAKVCSALFGVSGTVNGLACTATGPASMAVQIGAGELYQIAQLEATTCGTLPAITNYSILKQGIQLGTYTTSNFAVPGTSGQSINYLIEAQYQDSDISIDPTTGTSPVVLQYYNAANPTTPWSGPGNSGSTSNTFRDGIVAYQIKAGTAATTGSQVTPTPDSGWIGLWVVTVPYGATSLTNSNIAQYTGSPILPSSMLQSILTSNLTYGIDGGTANTVQAKFPLPVTTLVDGMDVWVKIAAANTGATTFTPNPGVISASPVIGAAHAALQGGELIVGGRANLIWRQDVSSWVLVECTGAAIQVAPATASQHAVQFGQATGRLLRATIYRLSSGVQQVSVNGGAFTTTGAGTFISLASTTSIIVEMCGGGGGSAGVPATGASTVAAAGGGAGAVYGKSYFTSGFSGGLVVTVGVGGTAGAAGLNNGGAGGTTSLGALMTCGAGNGSIATAAGAAPIIVGAGVSTTTASGVNLYGTQGGPGGTGFMFAASAGVGGNGGANGAGWPGPVGATIGSPGNSGAASYGVGASGGAQGNSGGALAGAPGGAGFVAVFEYA